MSDKVTLVIDEIVLEEIFDSKKHANLGNGLFLSLSYEDFGGNIGKGFCASLIYNNESVYEVSPFQKDDFRNVANLITNAVSTIKMSWLIEKNTALETRISELETTVKQQSRKLARKL